VEEETSYRYSIFTWPHVLRTAGVASSEGMRKIRNSFASFCMLPAPNVRNGLVIVFGSGLYHIHRALLRMLQTIGKLPAALSLSSPFATSPTVPSGPPPADTQPTLELAPPDIVFASATCAVTEATLGPVAALQSTSTSCPVAYTCQP